MTASSQTPADVPPQESPVRAPSLEAPVPPIAAAVGVIQAEMAKGHTTAHEIASAEQSAGLLFDPQRAQDIARAARAQAADEFKAELRALGEEAAAVDWFKDRLANVIALCAGRPDTDLMFVGEILTAADSRTPEGAPLVVKWDHIVMGPSGDTPDENTLVPCTTVHGTKAVLVLDDEHRLKLGGLLLASLHTAESCATQGCGMSAEELDASDPTVAGWICVQVAGTESPARWWCSPWCANAALSAGGAELAAVDQAAAVDPAAQAPEGAVDLVSGDLVPSGVVPPHAFAPERLGESDAKLRVARCRHCWLDRMAPVHLWGVNFAKGAGDGVQ